MPGTVFFIGNIVRNKTETRQSCILPSLCLRILNEAIVKSLQLSKMLRERSMEEAGCSRRCDLVWEVGEGFYGDMMRFELNPKRE